LHAGVRKSELPRQVQKTTRIREQGHMGNRNIMIKSVLAALLVQIAIAAPTPTFAANGAVEVVIDQTVPYKLDKPAQSVVVGNPSIADVIVQNNGLVFILGRSFGTTNLYAIDQDGNEIANVLLRVTANRANTVSLYKQTSRRTLVCGDTCEYTVMMGDGKEAFDILLDSAQKKAELAKDGTQ